VKVATVVGVVATTHGEFVAGVDLGHTAHGGEHGERELQLRQGGGGIVHEAAGVVVAEERDKTLGVREEVVEAKDFGELGHGCVFEKDITESKVAGEVEGCVEAGIDTRARDASGEGRGDGGIAVEDFADAGEMRVRGVEFGVEVVPESAADIGEGVEAEAVDSRLLNPPHGVLDEVALDGGVFLIKVGQYVGEPALRDVLLVAPGSMRVGDWSEFALGFIVLRERAVEPGGVGAVVDPRVRGADVIGHAIEDELHVARVQSGCEGLEVVEVAEVLVNAIEVGSAVAVIALRLVILFDGGDPDGGDAELLEVVEMLRDAAQVSAMPAAGFCELVCVIGAIVGGVTVSEAVGHDEVHNVRGGEACEAVARGAAGREGVGDFGGA
jgi:hypothetical protein